MRFGTTHPVQIFRADDDKIHATPAVKGWEHRSTICGQHNPVLGWRDIVPERGDPKPRASEVHAGRCGNAIKKALREQRKMEASA